jgi:hypothetical protein
VPLQHGYAVDGVPTPAVLGDAVDLFKRGDETTLARDSSITVDRWATSSSSTPCPTPNPEASDDDRGPVIQPVLGVPLIEGYPAAEGSELLGAGVVGAREGEAVGRTGPSSAHGDVSDDILSVAAGGEAAGAPAWTVPLQDKNVLEEESAWPGLVSLDQGVTTELGEDISKLLTLFFLLSAFFFLVAVVSTCCKLLKRVAKAGSARRQELLVSVCDRYTHTGVELVAPRSFR